jgi:4-diphosphocytidyl-2-C-methyl-D-erythritol kinase
MVMQSVSLYDELMFEPLIEDGVEVICNKAELQSDNIIETAFRKVQRFFPEIRHGFRVTLKKNIPVGAGLAGGSGNAAATVHYLLNENNIKPSPDILRQLLLSIGSDVVFSYRGGTYRVQGVGDVLLPYKTPHKHFLIVNPRISISTAEAYRLWDTFTPVCCRTGGRHKDPTDPHNAFESIIFPLYPEIGQLKSKLIGLGATAALMSGSGSTVFGIFNSKQDCTLAATDLRNKLYDTWIAHSVTMGISALKDHQYSC